MDKELLLKPRIGEESIEIPDVGVVRVRGLSRREVLEARKKTDEDQVDGVRVLALERHMLAAAMVDPAMTEDDIAAWQEAAGAGEIEPVVALVQRLSGLAPGAAKETYKSVRRGRR